MQITNNIIQLAKERALFGFAAMAQQMMQDADERMVYLLTETRSGVDQYTMNAGRQFIRTSGKVFLKRVETSYRDSLDRAMRTMYTDLRVALNKLSADNLSLIDDETVNRQIEVDRLVLRLRDSDDEHLRRLNLIIARLHGDNDVRERENPFRPYLMARALHHVLHEMVNDPEISKQLFDLLADALANRLADFYASIREVFESNGIHAQLATQKSKYVNNRYGEGSIAPEATIDLSARVMPGLQRVLELMNSAKPDGGQLSLPAGSGSENQSVEFQNFVKALFKQDGSAGAAPGGDAGTAGPTPEYPPAEQSVPGQSTQGHSIQERSPKGLVQEHAAHEYPTLELDHSAQEHAAQIPSPRESSAPDGPSPGLTLQTGSEQLVSRLNQYQQQASRGESVSEGISPEKNQLFAVGEQIGTDQATKLERVAIDVVAMLFELILGDEQIPESARVQIGRLQIPFLKAAMLTPDMLQQTNHPARRLVNRMGSAAVALDSATPVGQSVEREITRIVQKILKEFDDDVTIFSDCLAELESFLADNLYRTDSEAALSVEALEEAEQSAMQGTSRLAVWLAELDVDQRVLDFISNTWTQVLEHEASAAAQNPDAQKTSVYRDLLPDLIWSVQEKQNPEERAALMYLLPQLVRRLKAGLSLINLPEPEARQALDQLVEVHTQVLRTNPAGSVQKVRSLEELRQHFSDVATEPETEEPRPVVSRQFETELAKRGVSIDLDLEREPSPSFESDDDWLTRIQVGNCVQRWTDGAFQTARLTWISKRQTLYMFQLEKTSELVVYSTISLIKSMREGSVRLLEHAPIFERAVESLLIGAQSIQANSPQSGPSTGDAQAG